MWSIGRQGSGSLSFNSSVRLFTCLSVPRDRFAHSPVRPLVRLAAFQNPFTRPSAFRPPVIIKHAQSSEEVRCGARQQQTKRHVLLHGKPR